MINSHDPFLCITHLSLSLFISMISSSGWAGLGAGPGWVEADLCRVEQGEGLGVSLQVVGALWLVCTVHYFAVLYCTYPVLYVLYLGVGEGEIVPGAVPALRLVPLSRRLGLTLRLPPPEQWSDTRAFKYFFRCLCRHRLVQSKWSLSNPHIIKDKRNEERSRQIN